MQWLLIEKNPLSLSHRCGKMLPQDWEDKLQDGSSLYVIIWSIATSISKSVAFD